MEKNLPHVMGEGFTSFRPIFFKEQCLAVQFFTGCLPTGGNPQILIESNEKQNMPLPSLRLNMHDLWMLFNLKNCRRKCKNFLLPKYELKIESKRLRRAFP